MLVDDQLLDDLPLADLLIVRLKRVLHGLVHWVALGQAVDFGSEGHDVVEETELFLLELQRSFGQVFVQLQDLRVQRACRLLLCLLDGLHLLKGALSLLEHVLELGDLVAFFAVLQSLVVGGLEQGRDPLRGFQVRTSRRDCGCLRTALCRRFGAGFGGCWLGQGLL